MELLLNELSFHNQFESFEHFQNSALIEIIYFLNLQKSGTVYFLKKSDFYSNKIYDDKSLQEILISKDKDGKSDEIRKLKSQLINIINDPYWDNNKLCNNKSKYSYIKSLVNDTCLAEGYERNSNIVSLNPSNFNIDKLHIKKDDLIKTLNNYYSFKIFITKLYKDKIIEFDFFCKNYFTGSKLNFSLVNSVESFKHISKKSDEDEFLSSFKMFEEMDWKDILKQGGKANNKAGLAYTKYHDQKYFSKYSPKSHIYKFRTSQKYRVFGFRVDSIFYVLEFDLSHRLSD